MKQTLYYMNAVCGSFCWNPIIYLHVGIVFSFLLICTFLSIAAAQPLSCSSTDIDTNDNNLIDICYLEDLNAMRNNRNGYGTKAQGCLDECNGYELRNDLNFVGDGSYRDDNDIYFNNWQPIVFYDGVLDANAYTIYNLKIDRPDSDEVGLFESLGTNAKISGLKLANINIIGKDYVGGIAGSNAGEISDSYIINTDVTRGITGNQWVGGLVGENGGIISASRTSITVQGVETVGGLVGNNFTLHSLPGIIAHSRATNRVIGDTEVGGLVGFNGSMIINSYAGGSVRSASAGSVDLGGLVGLNDDRGNIVNSHANNTVTGFLYVGGLVGHNFGAITNSYAVGDVTSLHRDYIVGGLVGRNRRGTILNTYAIVDVTGGTGDITEDAAAGGLVGHITGGMIERSYAIATVKGNREGHIGGLIGRYDGGDIMRSYTHDRYHLVGSGHSEHIIDSFVVPLADLHLPVAAGSTSSEVYYQWSEDDWHFGTSRQYPGLKYAESSDAYVSTCDESPELPDCNTLLVGQREHLNISLLYSHIKVFLEGFLQRDH